jgi:hypothetical protein
MRPNGVILQVALELGGQFLALELDDRLIPRGNQQRRAYLESFAVFRGLDQDVIGFDKRLAVNPMIIHLPLPALGIEALPLGDPR